MSRSWSFPHDRPRDVRPDRGRPRPVGRTLLVVALLTVTAAALAACGDSGSTNQDVAAFKSRAGQTATGTWSAQYRLDTTGQKEQALVDIARIPDQLRLDITTPQGVATNISGNSGEVSCQTSPGKGAVCVQVALPGQTPAAALDPALRSVIANTLPAIASGRADVQYLGPSDDTKFPDATCSRVSGDGVANGVYCLFPDGVPASANFPSGSIAFVKRLSAPTQQSFQPPAVPRAR